MIKAWFKFSLLACKSQVLEDDPIEESICSEDTAGSVTSSAKGSQTSSDLTHTLSDLLLCGTSNAHTEHLVAYTLADQVMEASVYLCVMAQHHLGFTFAFVDTQLRYQAGIVGNVFVN